MPLVVALRPILIFGKGSDVRPGELQALRPSKLAKDRARAWDAAMASKREERGGGGLMGRCNNDGEPNGWAHNQEVDDDIVENGRVKARLWAKPTKP